MEKFFFYTKPNKESYRFTRFQSQVSGKNILLAGGGLSYFKSDEFITVVEAIVVVVTAGVRPVVHIVAVVKGTPVVVITGKTKE